MPSLSCLNADVQSQGILVILLVSSVVVRLEQLVALQQNLRRWHNDQGAALPRKVKSQHDARAHSFQNQSEHSFAV